MILTNCTDVRRGIALKQGLLYLEPREMRVLDAGQREEIEALFSCETFQRFVDQGIFQLRAISDDEQSVTVKTPPAPPELTAVLPVPGLHSPVGMSTGSKASEPHVVGYQTDGVAVVTTERKTKTKAGK